MKSASLPHFSSKFLSTTKCHMGSGWKFIQLIFAWLIEAICRYFNKKYKKQAMSEVIAGSWFWAHWLNLSFPPPMQYFTSHFIYHLISLLPNTVIQLLAAIFLVEYPKSPSDFITSIFLTSHVWVYLTGQPVVMHLSWAISHSIAKSFHSLSFSSFLPLSWFQLG